MLRVSTPPLAQLETCPQPSGRAAVCAGGAPIVLRGSNYIRLDPKARYHSTFAPGANFSRYGLALDAMHASGFNIARVFIDGRAESGGAVAGDGEELAGGGVGAARTSAGMKESGASIEPPKQPTEIA